MYSCVDTVKGIQTMTAFPGFPCLLKGALVGLDPANSLASVIVFQYNPETVARSMSRERGAASLPPDRPTQRDDHARH